MFIFFEYDKYFEYDKSVYDKYFELEVVYDKYCKVIQIVVELIAKSRYQYSVRSTNQRAGESGESFEMIKEQLNAESVSVKDAYGDGRHVSIDVISSSFEGKSAVNRQRMVYKAIWAELQNTVHAVDQMTTRTPAEAGIEAQ